VTITTNLLLKLFNSSSLLNESEQVLKVSSQPRNLTIYHDLYGNLERSGKALRANDTSDSQGVKMDNGVGGTYSLSSS
jgi:hypothetical protein